MHFKDGEEEILADYLWCHTRTLEEEDRTPEITREIMGNELDYEDYELLEEVWSNPSAISERDQRRAKLKEYEKESSFGKTKEEIISNARKHLKSCDSCYRKYKTCIEVRAYAEAEMSAEAGLNFKSSFRKHIKTLDVLEILDS